MMIKKRQKTSGEIICQLFSLLKYETIYQDYSCSLVQTILFFGRLYIGQDHFCFNSNMFGISKRFSIQIQNIKNMIHNPTKNSITFYDKNDKQYNFTNFFNSKNVYKLMYALWKGQQIEANILANDEQSDLKITDKSLSLQQSPVQSNFFNPEISKDEKQTIAQIIFPCSVHQYYEFFLADKATVYSQLMHLQAKSAEAITITEWKKNQELKRQARQISAIIKVTGIPLRSKATLNKVQSLVRDDNGIIYLDIVSQINDVPYSSYFTCDEHLSITALDQKRCKLKVEAWVNFNKSTYMKSTIKDRTLNDLKSDYQFWLKTVTQKIDKLKKSNFPKEKIKDEKNYQYEKVQSQSIHIQFSNNEKLENDPKQLNIIGSPLLRSKINLQKIQNLQKKVNILIIAIVILVIINGLNLLFKN